MGDVHIASYILQVQPILLSSVYEQIVGINNLAVPVKDENQSKLIVVIEGSSTQGLESHSEQIKRINGVISLTLVYHHVEAESELNQEMK